MADGPHRPSVTKILLNSGRNPFDSRFGPALCVEAGFFVLPFLCVLFFWSLSLKVCCDRNTNSGGTSGFSCSAGRRLPRAGRSNLILGGVHAQLYPREPVKNITYSRSQQSTPPRLNDGWSVSVLYYTSTFSISAGRCPCDSALGHAASLAEPFSFVADSVILEGLFRCRYSVQRISTQGTRV
jgi:hypothetical protein